MRILIAGAGGQLGRSLPAALYHHEVVALQHPELDITDLEQVREVLGVHHPNLVINASAFNDVDGAETQKAKAFQLNLVGPENLAKAAAEMHAACLHVSTDYVFDGEGKRPYCETDLTNPLSVYGKSKLAGEHAVAAANPLHYIVRTAWLYHEDGRNFLNTMISLASRGEVRVVRDQRGSPTYAPYLASAIADLIETQSYGVYHIAGAGGASWFELTRMLYALLGIRADVIPVSAREFPRPAARPRYSVLGTRREQHIHLPAWEEGLAEFASKVRRGKAAGQSN